MRSLVDNSTLPTAHRWEATRVQILRRWGRHDEADQARAAANNYGQRLLDATGVFVERIQ